MSDIRFRKIQRSRSISFWAILFVAILVSTFIGDLPKTGNLYYAVLIVNFVILFFKRKKIELRVLLFLLFLPVTIIVDEPDPLFKSWLRLGAFFLLMTSASPLIQCNYARNFRVSCLRAVLIASVIIAVVSFVFFFLGINYMVRNESSEYLERAGMFGGLTRQSMMLGPVSAMGAIYCIYLALKTKRKIFWLFAIPCLGSVLFAASRLAFAGMLAGLSIQFLIYSKRKSYFLKVLLSIIVVLLVASPLLDKGMERLRMKHQTNLESRGKGFSSRDIKWEHRLSEFSSNPFFGVGFCAMDKRFTTDYGEEDGNIEPGSSWLAILSMTGLIGAVLFLSVFLYCGKMTLKRNTNDSMLLFALLTFFLVHFVGEGYIFSAGGALCFFAWIVIGCSYDQKYYLSGDRI